MNPLGKGSLKSPKTDEERRRELRIREQGFLKTNPQLYDTLQMLRKEKARRESLELRNKARKRRPSRQGDLVPGGIGSKAHTGEG